MIKLSVEKCPICGFNLNEDSELYVCENKEIVGCENCIHISYPEIIYDDDTTDRYENYLWQKAKEEKYKIY